MVTLVGTQTNFKDVVVDLLELEYDAVGAYKLAVKKLDDFECKGKLGEFLADHERHIQEIKDFYASKVELPKSGDLIKGTLAKMKVAIGSIGGSDTSIIKAMLDNERDTNAAYKRVVEHPNLPQEANDVFARAYEDEKKHKKWMEDYLRLSSENAK